MRLNVKRKSNPRRLLFRLLAFAVLIVVWIIAYYIVRNEIILPSPLEVFKRIFDVIGQNGFASAFVMTLFRTVIAFLIVFASALILSVLGYIFPWISDLAGPLVTLARSLPTMAVLLIIIIWTNPLKAPVFVAFLALFPVLYSDFSAALAEIPSGVSEMSEIYGVPFARRLTGFYLPFVYPYVVKSSASAISFTLKVIVSAEIMSKTYNSIGGLMQEARVYLEMSSLFALAIIVVITGFILESLVLALLLLRRAENDYT
ncbi:MAG: ABC transporter permease subunit [Clostridia bacterium]|nr:ABC transporter permease subunit [Clostridia bacterium]